MSNTVQFDSDALYRAWRLYLKGNSKAKYFSAYNDKMLAGFPGATLMIVGRPTNTTDLQNFEYTVDLTVQTDCYTDNTKLSDLYEMDSACWDFFNSLGFRKIGDSIPSSVGTSNVRRMTSRFQMRNFAGKYLIELITE